MFSRAIIRNSKQVFRLQSLNTLKPSNIGLLTQAPLCNISPLSTPQQQQQQHKRLYHEKVIDHYENPRNVGTLNKNDTDVGTGLVGAPACGDVMRLQIKVDEKTGKIEDVKFKTFGCGSAIASSSYATELVKGKTLDEALAIKNTFIAQELSLPPVKLHCSMLAEDAIKSAVRDYRSKRSIKKPTLGPEAVASEPAVAATA
ncbi:ISU1 [Candida oxycetoniae]|uniref:Iron-sulfur cluster assembly protein n=1 Tax=Candida oxycetoniae TaxID=497107 RepID=A0AAI9T1B3_9ASCO|nr:ISU1 [Candida oxycetoniae]KAI3406524.1 ISU1 [Candida oxycetoniae]